VTSGGPGREQLPVLCRACGAPAEVGPTFLVRCGFCGMHDELPKDELDRALELKRRLSDAARYVAQVEGMERALATMFEEKGAFLRATGAYLVVLALVCVWAGVAAWPILTTSPGQFRAGLLLYAAMGPAMVGGFVLAIGFALLVGRMGYRRRVRPLLYARPPRAPGAPSRCRGCGADLPTSRSPIMPCRYCQTQNLVTEDILRDRARLLESENSFYRARAGGATAATSRIGTHMTRTLIVAIVVVYGGMFGIAALASALIDAAT
jgi:hypothetical protein